jgi:imidazolonepropionase-like amidohydrolase
MTNPTDTSEQQWPDPARPRAYRFERAFDGERARPGGALVLVRETRIEAVLPGGAPVPAGYLERAFPGSTVLPGLIDTHVHLCADGKLDALVRDPARTPAERELVIRAALRQQLNAGVTTVRDLGDHRWAVVERTPGPDEPWIVASGPPITTPGGHVADMGGEAAGAEALTRAVTERAERGADLVKVIVSGGAMTAGSDLLSRQYGPADVALVVRQAHRLGLPVTAHAHSIEAAQICLDAGTDGIEHCTCLTEHGLSPAPELIAALAAAAVVVGPTLGRVPGSAPSAQSLAVSARTGWTLPGRLAQVAGFQRAGLVMVSGSDAGIHPGKPHGVLPHAVRELVEAGVPAEVALASATSTSARACGLERRKGLLRAGSDADLLIVDGDPVADITALTRVRAVVLAGREVVSAERRSPPS